MTCYPNKAQVTNYADFSPSYSFLNVSAATTGTAVASSAGTLHSIVINTVGSGATLALYDGTSTAGTALATISGDTLATYDYDAAYSTGLYLVATGTTTAANVTLLYK